MNLPLLSSLLKFVVAQSVIKPFANDQFSLLLYQIFHLHPPPLEELGGK